MNVILIGLIVAIAFYIVCFLALNNFIVAIIPAALAIVYFAFFVDPQIKKYNKMINSFSMSYQFINNYLVALSIQKSLDVAFEHSFATLDENFTEKVGDMGSLNSGEKIRYLGNYFPFHFYKLFIDLIDMWQEQGGDILKMSNYLTNQIAEINEYITICKQFTSKKIIEFVILWSFSLAIIVVLRFALSQFYSVLITNSLYQFGVIGIFVFSLFSCQILISKLTKLEIKGWDKNGK